MKAIFLAKSPETVQRVYGDQRMAEVMTLTECPKTVYTSLDPKDPRVLEAEAIFSTWGMPTFTGEEIASGLPRLKAVFYAAGTVRSFARPFLDSGIRIFSAWQANAIPTAQYAFAQILLSCKGYFRAQPLMSKSRLASQQCLGRYPGIFDCKVGLLGCGAIGGRVAEMLRGSGVEVLVFDPFLSEERAAELRVRKTSLEEIFSACTVISNHLANLPETQRIIRREHLMSMLPDATFINTGRGAQLSEKDLFDALTACPGRTALLDVLLDEALTDENPLRTLPNCFLTPHMAGSMGNEVRRMADYMIEAAKLYLRGEPCAYEVTAKVLENMA